MVPESFFMWTFDGLYSIGMKTEQIRRVPGCYAFDVVPYSSFYIPGRQVQSVTFAPLFQLMSAVLNKERCLICLQQFNCIIYVSDFD